MPGAENPVPVSCICCAYYVLRFVVIASPLQGGRNNLGDACNLHWNSGASKRHCFGNITERSRILGCNIGRVRLLPTRFALFYQLCICLGCCGIWSRERIWWKFSNCRNRMSIPVFRCIHSDFYTACLCLPVFHHASNLYTFLHSRLAGLRNR